MIDLEKYAKNNRLCVVVKPNSSKNEIMKWDENRKGLRVNIAAPPDKDKANKELIHFFSKLLGRKVRIVVGLRSKEKVIEIV
jgi:uncharacterized protein (TIGR00251 family)